jgi:hypothetical protein
MASPRFTHCALAKPSICPSEICRVGRQINASIVAMLAAIELLFVPAFRLIVPVPADAVLQNREPDALQKYSIRGATKGYYATRQNGNQ